MVEWSGGRRVQRETRQWQGLRWGSEGSHTQTERFISSVTSVGWLLTRVRCGRAWEGGGGGGGVVRLRRDELRGKKLIPLPESRHLVPLATPSKPFYEPPSHPTSSHSRVNTHLGIFPIFSFSPVTNFFLDFSISASYTHWVFLDQEPAAAAAVLQGLPYTLELKKIIPTSLQKPCAYTHKYSQ